MSNKDQYKHIAKSTWIFGNAQVIVMISNIIKTKCVALFIGTSGYGILSLYQSAIALISTISNLGIGTSSIKDLAAAHASEDEKKVDKAIYLVKKLTFFTGIIGALLTILFSVQLSIFIFESPHFWVGFCWLSIAILLNQLTSANTSILRGLRKNKKLAHANITGALIGLALSVPMYYFMGKEAIVPTLIISSLATFVRSWYYTKDIKVEPKHVEKINLLKEGKPMIIMGVMLSITTLFTIVKSLLIKLYIEKNGGIHEVGLYHSGFLILNSYLGIIFSIMSLDYFPNLSANISNNQKARSIVNRQLVFGFSLILPLICIFLLLNPILIQLLFSKKFALIEGMLAFAVLGTLFKLIGWSQAYIILSKGDNRIYFWNELTGVIITLLISFAGYYWNGIDGLGIAYTVGFIYYALQTHLICNIKYGNQIDFNTYSIFFLCSTICISMFITVVIYPSILLSVIVLTLCLIYTVYLFLKMELIRNIKSIVRK